MIRIPEFTRSPYPLFILIGVVAGLGISVFLMKRKGVERFSFLLSSFLVFASIFILNFSWSLPKMIRAEAWGFDGTLSAVGLVAGAFVSALIFREKGPEIMASFVTGAPLMYSISKIGCFLNGCCRGYSYGGPLKVTYDKWGQGSFFPAQLLDVICFFAVFVLAFILASKLKDQIKVSFAVMLISILSRFGVDFFRLSHTDRVISKTQLLMISAFIIVIISFVIVTRINGKRRAG
ncbi:MAG: prolipoprotein diacylglyceryl transferase [Clostridiales bacterium]|nr:prolipoprotein diacylglyceryl transferase [Clostridiales bacterium]